jgi:hypothetical protein
MDEVPGGLPSPCGPESPGGDACKIPPHKNEKIRKDTIGIAYLFLSKDMIICIGLVHGGASRIRVTM